MTAAADASFLLPVAVHSADAVGGDSSLARALEVSGIAVRRRSSAPPAQLAVGIGAAAAEARRHGYPLLLLEGSPGRRLERTGYAVERFLSLPGVDLPSLLLPLRRGEIAAYALANWTFPRTTARRMRSRAAQGLLRRGILPALLPTVAVAARTPRPPFLLAAAADVGIPPDAGYFVRSGGLDELSRSTFFVFERGARRPTWLLKFSRVRDYRQPFDRDERGLRLVAAAPPSVARHAPRLLGRVAVDGFHASVETAAVGKPLGDRLRAPGGAAAKRSLVDAVAAWIVELGASTRRDDGLEAERACLAGLGSGASDLLARLPTVPTVLQHNDLGCWNVIAHERSFVAVDWESAHAGGLPLWDLWYFLVDALASLDGVPTERRRAHLAALFRGDLPSSQILFHWTRIAVESLAIPPAAVGILATLCWLHHARSHERRAADLAQHAPGSRTLDAFPLPREWFTDSSLGPDWRAWQG
jgi:hypothetical protein